ncbi:hypothetical protein NPIL_414731 [Nephila pilipes]|uniref:Uncharacterized protein n=1 Tax=Nephila pilipes TaxID=299642 RepID=A0A8X6M874_NEPPI|nr:hypothetical protein NPIL_414731 [Nephila pilipes]
MKRNICLLFVACLDRKKKGTEATLRSSAMRVTVLEIITSVNSSEKCTTNIHTKSKQSLCTLMKSCKKGSIDVLEKVSVTLSG